MNSFKPLSSLCLFVTSALILTGCMYTHKPTDLTYFLHTEYDVFAFDEHPTITPSNFIAFCTMPMEKSDDDRGRLLTQLVEFSLTEHGYYKVSKDELVIEPRLIPRTFLVGLGYTESFTYDSLQIQLDLFQIDPESQQNNLFWSWKAKFDGYPICRDTVEPALKDVFTLEPIDWNRTEPIFPPMSASTNAVKEFMGFVASARRKLLEKKAQEIELKR